MHDVMDCFSDLRSKSWGNGSFRFLGWDSQVKLLCMFVAGVFAVCVTAWHFLFFLWYTFNAVPFVMEILLLIIYNLRVTGNMSDKGYYENLVRWTGVVVRHLWMCVDDFFMLYMLAPQIGTGPVLALGRPVLELGRARPHTGTCSSKLIWWQFGDIYWLR
jgi:hypothetical protein